MQKYLKSILKDGTRIFGNIKKNYCLVSSNITNQKFVCIYDTDNETKEVIQSNGYYIADFAANSYPYFIDTPFGKITNKSIKIFKSETEMLKEYKYC